MSETSSKTQSKSLVRSSAIMFTGTLVSRLLGFVRNALIVVALGATASGAADAFNTANALPTQLYNLLLGGILNAVLVPQIVRALKHEDGSDIVNRLLTAAGTLVAAVTAAITIASPFVVMLYASGLGRWQPLALAFTFWCMPQIFFYALTALWGQVLNAKERFGPYMWAPVVNNIVAITSLLAYMRLYGSYATGEDPQAWDAMRITVIAGGATLGIVLQALSLYLPLRQIGFRPRLVWGVRGIGLRQTSIVATWALAGVLVTGLADIAWTNLGSSAVTAAEKAADTGLIIPSTTMWANAQLIYLLPQSLVTTSIVTALFTRMSIKAAERGADILLSQGLFVRIALLPDGQDPDDFAKSHNLEEVKEFIARERTDFIRFKTGRLLKESENDPAQRAQLTQDLLKSIALVEDQILRAVYVQETARIMGFDEATLTDQLGHLRLSRSINPRPQPTQPTTPAEEQVRLGAEEGGNGGGKTLRDKKSLFANELDLIRLLLLYGKRIIHIEQEENAEDATSEEPSAQEMTVAQYIFDNLEADEITLQDEDLAAILAEYKEQEADIDDGIAHFSMHERPRVVELVVDLSVPKYKLSKRWEQDRDDEATAMHTLRVNLEHSMLSYKARLLELLTREAMEGLDGLEGEALEERLREIQELNAIRNEFAQEIQRIIP